MLRVLVLVLVAGLVASGPALGQTSVWVEGGLGVGAAGEGGGVQGRAALAVLAAEWGGELRVSAHDGAQTPPDDTFLSGLFGGPRESFYDTSVLLLRSLTPRDYNRVLVGVGVGAVTGKETDPTDGRGVVDMERVWGVPFELAFHGGDGRGVGLSAVLFGHINGRANHFGVNVAISLGFVAG